jgi:hypothetical protein
MLDRFHSLGRVAILFLRAEPQAAGGVLGFLLTALSKTRVATFALIYEKLLFEHGSPALAPTHRFQPEVPARWILVLGEFFAPANQIGAPTSE